MLNLRLSSITLLSLLVALSGCSKKSDTASSEATSAKRKVVIGFIGKSQTNDVFQAAHAGAKAAAKELADKYGVDVELEIRTPNDEDPIKQAEAVEALTRRGATGIALSCSESNTVTPAIDKAVSKGIPVVCFDSDAPESKRFAFYGTDDISCGERIADQVAKAMGGNGVVAVLAGNQSAPNLQKRVEGTKKAFAKYPGIKLNEPGVFFHVETPEKSAEAVVSAQNANPSIQGWAFIGGWPLFTADALKWAPGSVKVTSCDALPAQLDYVRKGYVDTLFAQDCYGWGYKSVEMLLEKIVNDKVPSDPRVVDPLTEVTKANVDEFAKNWDKWLAK